MKQKKSNIVPHLFVPLASAPGVPDGADDPGPSQRVVPQQPRPVGQVVAVRVGAGVWVGHGGDDGGLHHPLQILAGRDCIDGGDEGTVGAGHVEPVLLEGGNERDGIRGDARPHLRKLPGIYLLLSTSPASVAHTTTHH